MVVLQQGVETDGVLAGQMAIDRRIAEGLQLPVVAVAAGDPWLLAEAWPPLIGAGRRIARAPAAALPAQGLDVVTAAEETPEQRHLLLRGTGALGRGCLCNRRGFRRGRFVGSPGDAVGLQKPNQADVLPVQPI